MKSLAICVTSLVVLLSLSVRMVEAAWVNEIHYDNDGVDVVEAIEIVIGPSENIAEFSIELYNGNNGATYKTIGGSEFFSGVSSNGFQIYSVLTVIQNGAPDGLALIRSGNLVEFLSYEGSFTAIDGTAIGEMSTDIGVQETSTTPIGFSLQRAGTGNQGTDFEWMPPAKSTAEAFNMGVGQTITAVPEPSSLAVLAFIGAVGISRRLRRKRTK